MKNSAILILLSAAIFLGAGNGALAQAIDAAQNTGIFTGKDAAAAVTEALIRQGAGNDIKVSLTEARDEDTLAEAASPITADTDGLSVDKEHRSWQATLLLKANGRNLAPVRLSGHYDEMAAIPVLKRRIQPGEVIAEADIDWDKQPIQHIRKNTVTDAHDLIGKSPKHLLSQGRAIRMDEIANPAIVNKGTHVTLIFKSRNIEIMTYGEALDAGAKGDVIRVRNLTSKAVIQGMVESDQRVRVSSPDSDAAEIGYQEPGARSQE